MEKKAQAETLKQAERPSQPGFRRRSTSSSASRTRHIGVGEEAAAIGAFYSARMLFNKNRKVIHNTSVDNAWTQPQVPSGVGATD